jgi:hypothetical protein
MLGKPSHEWRVATGMKKLAGVLLRIVIAVFLALPLTVVLAVVFTPLLWRLEPVLNIELAGHSGPADWILVTLFALASLFCLWLLFRRWPLSR